VGAVDASSGDEPLGVSVAMAFAAGCTLSSTVGPAAPATSVASDEALTAATAATAAERVPGPDGDALRATTNVVPDAVSAVRAGETAAGGSTRAIVAGATLSATVASAFAADGAAMLASVSAVACGSVSAHVSAAVLAVESTESCRGVGLVVASGCVSARVSAVGDSPTFDVEESVVVTGATATGAGAAEADTDTVAADVGALLVVAADWVLVAEVVGWLLTTVLVGWLLVKVLVGALLGVVVCDGDTVCVFGESSASSPCDAERREASRSCSSACDGVLPVTGAETVG
jgi:hypothetical protein